MTNKKLTKVLKKMAAVAILTSAAAAPLAMTAHSASAATYTASKYFPGGDDMDNAYEDNSQGSYFRNFKTRSANIYVKDKKLKKVYQKAAKTWAPVFKFKFVKSSKHANFNSSKYANVVVLKDGGSKGNYATVNKLQFIPGSMKNLKKMEKEFPSMLKMSWYNGYVEGKVVNYKKWAANYKKAVTGKGKFLMPQHNNASKVGMWIPSESDAKKNSWNHYITIASGTKDLTQAQQVGNATEVLGEIIGIGRGANPMHEDEEVWHDDSSMSYYNYKVTQSDLDHVDWIYAHPWTGSNCFWDNRSLNS